MSRVRSWPPLALVKAHPRRFLAAGAAVAVAATAALELSRADGEPANLVTARPDTVVALDPSNNRLVDAFGVGRVPTELATGGENVWVFNSADGTVSRIEPRRRTVRTLSLGPTGFPRIGLALGPDSAWVAVGTVYHVDLGSSAVRTIRLPKRAGAGLVAAGGSDVWLIGAKLPLKPPPPGRLAPLRTLAWHIDPQTNEVTRAIRINAEAFGLSSPTAAVIAGNSLWVRCQLGVLRLDRRTGRFRSKLTFGDDAHENVPQFGGFVAGAGFLWVTDIGRSAVFRVSLKTGVTVATIPVSGRPAGVAIGAGAVWIADGNGMILKLDPRTNEIDARIPVDGIPNGLDYGFGRLWIALD